MNKRRVFHLWLLLFPAVLMLWYFPVIDFPIRVATWAVAFLIVTGSVFFAFRIKVLSWFLIAFYGLIVLFFTFPTHHPFDRELLRSDYCSALKAYLGCRYVWGGEGYLGIDCSGFVRKGLEDALAQRGVLTLDSSLIRDSISLYWHDTNAKAIGEGYFGRTYLVTNCKSLNTLDYALVMPGDLAVTAGGDHVMAYLGNHTWIAADPSVWEVATFSIPEEKNSYFSTPMKILRWKELN